MRQLLLILCICVSAVSALAQVRPDFFPEEVNPNNANFELYSQKNGVNRRASLANLRKYFGAQIVYAGMPAPTGNAESVRNKVVVVLPDSATYFVDWAGNATPLGGGVGPGGGEVQNVTISGDTLCINTPDSLYCVVIPTGSGGDNWGTQVVQRDSTLRGNGTAGDPLRVNRDSFPTLISVAAKLNIADTTSMLAPYAQGSGTVNFFPIWTGTRTLARSILQQPDTNHVSLATKPLRLGAWTTAGQPATPFQGYLGYNTTGNTPTWYNGTSWVVPAQSASATGLGTTNQVGYYNTSGQLTGSSNLVHDGTVLRVGTSTILGNAGASFRQAIVFSSPAQTGGLFITDNYNNQSVAAGLNVVVSGIRSINSSGIDNSFRTNTNTDVNNTFSYFQTSTSAISARIIDAHAYIQPGLNTNITTSSLTYFNARSQPVTIDTTHRYSLVVSFAGHSGFPGNLNSGRITKGVVVNAGLSADGTRQWYPFNIEGGNYRDSSTTGHFRAFNFTTTISQGPQSTTPSHGIYLAPTLNSVFDYRAIETTNNVGHALYLSGTAPSRIRGWTRIGSVAATPSQALHVTGKIQVDTLTDTPARLAAFTGTTGSGVLTRALLGSGLTFSGDTLNASATVADGSITQAKLANGAAGGTKIGAITYIALDSVNANLTSYLSTNWLDLYSELHVYMYCDSARSAHQVLTFPEANATYAGKRVWVLFDDADSNDAHYPQLSEPNGTLRQYTGATSGMQDGTTYQYSPTESSNAVMVVCMQQPRTLAYRWVIYDGVRTGY